MQKKKSPPNQKENVMSAVSSVAVIAALVGLAKVMRPLGSRLGELAKTSSASLGKVTARALQAAGKALTAELPELPSVPNAIEQVNRIERLIVDDLRRRRVGGNDIDLEKTGVIASVLRAPIVAENLDRVQAALAAVEASTTRRELAAARSRLHQVLAAEHGDAWLTTLQEITEKTYSAIGFRTMGEASRSEREVRLSAINGDGKVLVSELRLGKDGSPSMATEVVNGCGADCEAILEQFDKELAKHVRGSAPMRKPTGGVCQLDAAVAFVKRRVPRITARPTPKNSKRIVRAKRVAIQTKP